MGFAILRHGKIKGAGKGVSVAHNHRLATEKTPNIDGALTGLNWSAWDAKVVDRINNLLPEKTRKDAVQVVEVLLTASPDFFKSMGESMLAIRKNKQFSDWVAASVKWAQKEFGKNLVDIVLHMDEATPHFHILSVPITKDGRLCGKEVMAKKELQRRQTEYAAVVAPFGLQRGEASSSTGRIHVPLKSKAKVNEEIEALKAENGELKNKVQGMFNYINEIVPQKSALEMVNKALLSELEAIKKARSVDVPAPQAENLPMVDYDAFLDAKKDLPRLKAEDIKAHVAVEGFGRFAIVSLRGEKSLVEYPTSEARELAMAGKNKGLGQGVGR